jgi:hypothetical protein
MAPTHEEICQRAYSLWEERGCPDGSPEVDWYRAERELSESSDRPADLGTAADDPSAAEVPPESGKRRARRGVKR